MLEKSLPSEYYRSPEIFAKERERIFSREWVCAGRADELQRGKARDRPTYFPATNSSIRFSTYGKNGLQLMRMNWSVETSRTPRSPRGASRPSRRP